jgi:hypothetical protein
MMGLTSYFHRVVLGLVLVLIVLGSCHATLDQTEIDALEQLFVIFPRLTAVDPYYQYGDQPSPDIDYGGSWNVPFTSLCTSNIARYEYYGLHCSADGHIDGIRLYVSYFHADSSIDHSFPLLHILFYLTHCYDYDSDLV